MSEAPNPRAGRAKEDPNIATIETRSHPRPSRPLPTSRSQTPYGKREAELGSPSNAAITSPSESVILLTGNAVTLTDTGQGPYDGSEDTYIGVINNSGGDHGGEAFVEGGGTNATRCA